MLGWMSANSRVPVVVVSGFLGSGKTTLVRHLLAAAQRSGRRAAVVSNEFGELGIDGALLNRAGDDYVELSGGCVCCRLSDELVETLQMLRERANPDLVIIETSGVALPFDVQLNFWREPIADWIETDVTVIVVNAEQLANGRDLDGTFAQQVSSADLLLLNKLDLVAAQAIPELEAALREIEPTRRWSARLTRNSIPRCSFRRIRTVYASGAEASHPTSSPTTTRNSSPRSFRSRTGSSPMHWWSACTRSRRFEPRVSSSPRKDRGSSRASVRASSCRSSTSSRPRN